MVEHTKGPWFIAWDFGIIPADHAGRSLGFASDDAYDRDHYAQMIARVCRDRHGRGDQGANARLIAAAPELFEALYRLTTECELDGMASKAGYDCWLSVANAALKKAAAP